MSLDRPEDYKPEKIEKPLPEKDHLEGDQHGLRDGKEGRLPPAIEYFEVKPGENPNPTEKLKNGLNEKGFFERGIGFSEGYKYQMWKDVDGPNGEKMQEHIRFNDPEKSIFGDNAYSAEIVGESHRDKHNVPIYGEGEYGDMEPRGIKEHLESTAEFIQDKIDKTTTEITEQLNKVIKDFTEDEGYERYMSMMKEHDTIDKILSQTEEGKKLVEERHQLENLLGEELSKPQMTDKSLMVDAVVNALEMVDDPSGPKDSELTDWRNPERFQKIVDALNENFKESERILRKIKGGG